MRVNLQVELYGVDEKFERWRDAVDPARTWTQARVAPTGARATGATPGVGPLLLEAAELIAAEAARTAPVGGPYPNSRRGGGYTFGMKLKHMGDPTSASNRDRSSGRLMRSMRAILGRVLGIALAAQDVKADDSYYARWVERGTKPHYLGRKSRRASGRGDGNMHPGSKAQPFFRDAVKKKRYEARKLIEAGLKHLIEAAK